MPPHRLLPSTALVLAAATAAATVATAVPAAAAQPAGPAVHAVLTLAHHGQARADVTAWAQRHGLAVTHADRDSVVLEGSAATAGDAFDTTVSRGARPKQAAVPGALRGAVTSVAGFDTRPLNHPMSVPGGYSGADMDAAYGITPSSTAGAGLTIATVQFSGWNPADATTYAQAAGIPLAPGQVTSVPVNGASVTTSQGGGDLEVALDVESILAVAPAAKQRVYVTTNDYAGSLAVYRKIAADAAAGVVQLVSTSWGMCEADVSSSTLTSLAAPIQQAVSAGATYFASSGDYGAYGCSYPGHQDTRLSTIFPASAPSVVSVGGTTLNRTSTGWSETAWSGSGGGVSKVFARPAYQASLSQPGTGRLVPDVSAVADASTGLTVYIGSVGGWTRAGGTSLASPLWAAGLGAALSAAGRTTGPGDIHGALYAAGATLRDVTTGSTGPYSAGPGYDLVTGLGSPQWSLLAPALGIVTSTPPAAPAPTGPATTGGTTTTGGDTQTTRTTGPTSTPGPTAPTTAPAPAPTPTPDPTSVPASGPRTTVHACPAGIVPVDPFLDVVPGDVHGADVACVAWWGVAQGVSPLHFAPAGALTRAQMAAFLTRVVTAAGGRLPAAPPNAFPDDDTDPLSLAIDQLAAVGIVLGGTDGRYHPAQAVTRGEMALFVTRTYAYVGGGALGPAAAGFPDVASGSALTDAIDAVAGAGIAVGYPDGTFRPAQPVTREEVASFLARLLDLLVTDRLATLPV